MKTHHYETTLLCSLAGSEQLEVAATITFDYKPEAAPIYNPPDDADPGYPAEVEIDSVELATGKGGAMVDAPAWLLEWAQRDTELGIELIEYARNHQPDPEDI